MLGARLKPEFEAEAKARQANSTGGVSPQLQANLPEAEKGQSRDKAAAAVGVSSRSVESATSVLKNGTPELVSMVDAGEVAVRADHRPRQGSLGGNTGSGWPSIAARRRSFDST